jgi:hypothetical protein
MELLKEFANASQINIPTFAKTNNIPILHISTFYFYYLVKKKKILNTS